MNLRVGLGALALIAGIVACSGGTGSSSGTVAGGGTDRAAFVDEFCNAIGQCCARVNKPANPAQCKQLLDQLAGQLEYDAAKGSQCLSSVRSRQSSPGFCDDITPDDSCNGVFKEKSASGGTKQLGEACEKDADCVSSPEGKVDCVYAGASKRFCQVSIEYGREGDGPCSYTKDGNTSTSESSGSSSGDAGTTNPPRAYVCNVADGLYCQNGQACAKMGAPGQPCSTSNYSSFQCGKNGTCDYKSKTCIEKLGVGGDCSTGSNVCKDDTRCDTATRKCVAKLADAQPCESSLDCASQRCSKNVCAAKSSGDDESLKLFCGQ